MDLLMSNIWLVLYIIAWIVTFILYQKKKRYFDAGSVLLCSYLLYSIASLLLFNDPYLGSKYKALTLFPFIYMYLMLMVASSPVLKYDVLKINKIQKPRNVIFYTICIIFIISSIARVPRELPNYIQGLMRIMLDAYGGLDIYNETMANSFNSGDGKISNLPAIISNSLSDIGVLLYFYYLTLEKRNKLISIGLLISCIFPILGNISISQRGPVLEQLITLIITYFALRKFIQAKIIKIIQRVGIILIIATTIPIIAISISRFGGNEGGTLSSIYDYAGMQNLNFNNYAFDNGGIRYGDRTFPIFKQMLGFDNVPHNFWERRDKYPFLKINDEVFISFVGDFVLDFGPIIAVLIFIFVALFFLKHTRARNGTILFHQLILLHFIMCVCMQGGMKLFSFSDLANLRIIVVFIAYIFFRFDYENRQKRTKVISNS